MYILPNVSQSKNNEAMKFGQWIECNQKNIFIQKSYGKCDRMTSSRSAFFKEIAENLVQIQFPDPFIKSQNWAYLWINSVKFYTVCCHCIANWRLSKYIETGDHLLLPQIKLFWKIKIDLELVSLSL